MARVMFQETNLRVARDKFYDTQVSIQLFILMKLLCQKLSFKFLCFCNANH